MENKSSRLRQHEQEELAAHQHAGQQTGREFATPEELLRYDAARTSVPVAVVQRLEKSVARQPKPPRSWWQRLFAR